MTADFPFPFDSQTRADALHLIELALVEDVGSCDLTTAIDGTTRALFPDNAEVNADIVTRQSGIVCGLQICQLAIEHFAPKLELEINVADSQSVSPGQALARISGDARDILVMERTCLNFLCRLSAISTLTRAFVERVAGTQAKILDTRKTTPGWRRLEKYAVQCGGGLNHRMGLYDAIMIKDNHLAMHASVVQDHELLDYRSHPAGSRLDPEKRSVPARWRPDQFCRLKSTLWNNSRLRWQPALISFCWTI